MEVFSRVVVVANRGGLEVLPGIALGMREELPNGTALRVGW